VSTKSTRTHQEKAAMTSVDDLCAHVEGLSVLPRVHGDLYPCLLPRADELFELADALLCTRGPVKTLVGLALAVSTGAGAAPCTTR
jgi:hypothetical protein